jgi:hypothetical protein
MASQTPLCLLDSSLLASSPAEAGRVAAGQFSWPHVRVAWLDVYAALLSKPPHPRQATASK